MLENYKIKVKDEAESKEAQVLFFELGYARSKQCQWLVASCIQFLATDGEYLHCWDEEKFSGNRFKSLPHKELTLPSLRDLVVLKRNDVKDATHTCENDFKYICIDGRWHLMTTDGWFQVSVNPKALKPIQTVQAVLNNLDELREEYKDYHKDPSLISGAEAFTYLINGSNDVQTKLNDTEKWRDVPTGMSWATFANPDRKFRLKPLTIKLELEFPKPFEPKAGDMVWCLTEFSPNGYEARTAYEPDDFVSNLGYWRTEEEIKQVVEQLRKILGV